VAIRYDEEASETRPLMKTLHLHASKPDDVAHAANLLRDGRLVAFATETVYGLGANALNQDAVASIFTAKQRPAWDPLIVHLASPDQLSTITEIPALLASRISALASAFWPGPLTLLLPRSPAISDAVTAGRELVGVRIPAHPVAHALLQAAGLPIAAPSANLFGRTSPTTAEHVLADLNGRIDAVLDAGPTSIGLESTVLDPTQTPMVVYRPGAIASRDLLRALPRGISIKSYAPGAVTNRAARPSPGIGMRHYAPRATLVLTDPTPENLMDRAADQKPALPPEEQSSLRMGVLLPTGWPALAAAVSIFDWGPLDNPEILAARLYTGLRTLDDAGVTHIMAPQPSEHGGLYDAIRDRLRKAARPA